MQADLMARIELTESMNEVLDQKIDQAVARAVAHEIHRLVPVKPDYYTLASAAKLAHVAYGTLTKWINEEGLPVVLVGQGVQRIKRTDLEDFMTAHKHSLSK